MKIAYFESKFSTTVILCTRRRAKFESDTLKNLNMTGQRFKIILEIDFRTSNIINEFHGIEMEKKRKSFRVVF